MNAPNHLLHKPIIERPDYATIDSIFYRVGQLDTDAQAISIGLSQYNPHKEITAKMWRNPRNKWSRQSEELPLHRVLDMAILIIENLKTNLNGMPTGTAVSSNDDLHKIESFYKTHAPEFENRLKEIEKAIKLHRSKP